MISNSWKIALAKPDMADKITREILNSAKAHYENKAKLSSECNTRKPVAKKAEKFLRKYKISL